MWFNQVNIYCMPLHTTGRVFQFSKSTSKTFQFPPGGIWTPPPPLPPFFNFFAAKCFYDLGCSSRLNGRVRERPVLFRGDQWNSIFPPILEYTDNSDPREKGCTKYKRNEKDLKWNWLAFYSEPNNRVLYSILSLVFVFIFVCLSSMSLCLSCLYVFVREWLVAGKFTWVKHPSSWSICGHRSYLRFFQPPPPSYTDLITPATDLLS